MTMSLLGQQWIVENQSLEVIGKCAIENDSVRFHDPFLLPQMQPAVERIQQAMGRAERIVIFGDYDVDGISGTAILVHTLRALGAQVSYRLPDRQSGYGLNLKWIDELASIKANLVITVDCGISNHTEVEAAKQAGIDMIITDHHTLPSTIPKATAIIHPQYHEGEYPFTELSGSGMAYKLAVALWHHLGDEASAAHWQQKLVDLASLGTVADCVPLVGENRWIVREGIHQMRETEWPGLKTLLQKAGIETIDRANADLIGFRLGPRINAAGRLETPYYALQLLLNENSKADQFAEKLEQLNLQRRSQVEVAMESANAKLQQKHGDSVPSLIFLHDVNWPAGIIGLLAARLQEKHHRPTIIMEDRGDHLVGSCRSPEYLNIVEILTECGDHFRTFGGHAAAAGFSLEKSKLEEAERALVQATQKRIPGTPPRPSLQIPYTLTLDQITWELLASLEKLEPFGVQNPPPRFLIENVKPENLQTVGREHRHLKFNLKTSQTPLSAIAFRFGPHHSTLFQFQQNHQTLDIVVELHTDTWRDQKRINLHVVDMRVNK